MTTTTNIPQLKFNKLTESQYEGTTPVEGEFYLTPEADYALNADVVHKAGDETITGQKTFTGNGRITYLKSTVIDRTTPPSSGNLYAFIDVTDKNDDRLGVLGGKIGSDGKYGTYLQAGNEANIFVKSDGTNGYFEFPRCTTAATTTSTAANDKVAVIVTNYKSGTNWYRVWSDGWIEQGGLMSSGTTATVTLHKPFVDTNYSILTTEFTNGSTDTEGVDFVTMIRSKTTTSFSCSTASGRTNHWYAYGY